MPTRCEIRGGPDRINIWIPPERSIWDAAVSPLLILFIASVAPSLGWSGLFLWGVMGYLVWRFVWNLFGIEEVEVNYAALTITSRVLLFHRTRRFDSADVDWIAYHPRAYRSPSGIGILVKDKVMPFQIAYDLGPEDAETALQAIKSNIPGLSSRVRGLSETSFYKPG